MLAISEDERSGVSQNVHGPRPSFTHTIFPQLRQFGAMVSNGWRVAMQLHLRFARSAADCEFEASVGLVCSSRDRMAESRSERVFPAPCMLVPPVMLTFVLVGAGDAVRGVDDRDDGGSTSEIKGPDAEGGALGPRDMPPAVRSGSCLASGASCRASVFDKDACGFFLEDPAI